MWSKSRLIVYREAGKCPQGGWKAASRTTLGTAIFGSELLRRFEPLGHYHRNVARSWYEPVFDSRAPGLINSLRSDLSFFLHHFLSNFPTRRSVSPSWNLNLTFRIIPPFSVQFYCGFGDESRRVAVHLWENFDSGKDVGTDVVFVLFHELLLHARNFYIYIYRERDVSLFNGNIIILRTNEKTCDIAS